MKTWQRYVFIHIPIGIFCCIINFCVKNDDRPPYAKYHLLHEFEKDEYSVKDLVTGSNLGELILHKEGDMLYFNIFGKATSGKLMIGEYGKSYDYDEIGLQGFIIEKIKNKNLEFYAGNVGYWYSVVIMDLDEYDYEEYYKSDNKKRYLFYLLKIGDYNFSTKDASVYDVYSAFGSSMRDMKYAAILE